MLLFQAIIWILLTVIPAPKMVVLFSSSYSPEALLDYVQDSHSKWCNRTPSVCIGAGITGYAIISLLLWTTCIPTYSTYLQHSCYIYVGSNLIVTVPDCAMQCSSSMSSNIAPNWIMGGEELAPSPEILSVSCPSKPSIVFSNKCTFDCPWWLRPHLLVESTAQYM